MSENSEILKELLQCVVENFNKNNKNSKNDSIEEFLIYHKLDILYSNLYGIHKTKRQTKLEKKMSYYFQECNRIAQLAKVNNINIVFLKSVALVHEYKDDYFWRYYSDIDLLIAESEIGKIENVLEKMEYKYGIVRNGEIVEPTRKQILLKKMYTHEMYPMVKVKDGFSLYADINFKFSWKVNDSLTNIEIPLQDVFNNIDNIRENSTDFPILNRKVNFIHLCVHFYNEAIYFAMDDLYNGGDPKEFRLFRIIDIIIVIQSLDSKDFIWIASYCEKYSITEKIKFVLKCIYLIFGEKYLNDIGTYIDYKDINVNYYCSRKGKIMEWNKELISRVFNKTLRKKIIEEMEF